MTPTPLAVALSDMANNPWAREGRDVGLNDLSTERALDLYQQQRVYWQELVAFGPDLAMFNETYPPACNNTELVEVYRGHSWTDNLGTENRPARDGKAESWMWGRRPMDATALAVIDASQGLTQEQWDNQVNGGQSSVEDVVNHPSHYKLANGFEVIDLTEMLDFCRGNAVKYLARAGEKDDELQDLKKAEWYVKRAILKLERERAL